MRLNRLVLLAIVGLLSINVVSSTLIATALGTGFIGGFLMGKITLGVFLTAMNSLNQNQRPTSPTSVTINTQAVPNKGTRGQSVLDIPDAVDAEVRDRFLRQIGRMDPLDCLPKVFCQVSADPIAAKTIFGPDALKVLSQNSPFNPNHVKNKEEQHDSGDDDSDSQSDEDNDVDNKVEEMIRQEEEDLKVEGLEHLIYNDDDPLNYYFAMKEKNKPISPQLWNMVKDMEFSRRKLLKKNSDDRDKIISKRVGTFYTLPVQTPSRSSSIARKSDGTQISVSRTATKQKESSIDDVFDSDPFFEEFSKSLPQPQQRSISGGLVNVGLLRRSRRDVFDSSDEEIMVKYKLAAETAEQKDPKKCQKVFNTCPFSAEEVMDMIAKFNLDDSKASLGTSKKNKLTKQDSLTGLKNTLTAIEKLNDATLNAEALGEPIDYSQLIKDATESSSLSDNSAKIVKEIQQIEDRFVPSIEAEQKPETLIKKKLIMKKKIKKQKKQSVRRRRHDDESRIHLIPVRISARSKNGNGRPIPRMAVIRQPETRFIVSSDRDDEFFNAERQAIVRGHTYIDEHSNEGVYYEEIKLPGIYLKEPVQTSKPRNKPEPNAEFRKVQLDDDVEDDEFNSPESEETVKVPSLTFSQTFIETLDAPISHKPKPKPIHKVVKVKPQSLRLTSASPSSVENTATTITPKRPIFVPKLKQKFSDESEDDEEDAINSEKQIEALVSKYKPRDKLH